MSGWAAEGRDETEVAPRSGTFAMKVSREGDNRSVPLSDWVVTCSDETEGAVPVRCLCDVGVAGRRLRDGGFV